VPLVGPDQTARTAESGARSDCRSHPYHRLSKFEVLAAAELYRAGWSLAKLGQKFNVDDTTVWRRLRHLGVQMRGPTTPP